MPRQKALEGAEIVRTNTDYGRIRPWRSLTRKLTTWNVTRIAMIIQTGDSGVNGATSRNGATIRTIPAITRTSPIRGNGRNTTTRATTKHASSAFVFWHREHC